MIDVPHGLTLTTTVTPKPDRRRAVTPPVLTVARGLPATGGVAAPLHPAAELPDDAETEGPARWMPYFLEAQKAKHREQLAADLAAERARLLVVLNHESERIRRHELFRARVGREDRIAKKIDLCRGMLEEVIAARERTHMAAITATTALASSDNVSDGNHLFARGLDGDIVCLTLRLAGVGPVAEVRVAGAALQARVAAFLFEISKEYDARSAPMLKIGGRS